MATYQTRFANNFMNTNLPMLEDNSGGAGNNWCSSQWQAKASQMANNIMYYWGLAKDDGTEPKYSYKCNNSYMNLWGLLGGGTIKYYYGVGHAITIYEGRELVNCEEIETLELYALQKKESADLRLTTMSAFGGAAAKNAKIDSRKWQIVYDWAASVRVSSDGINFDSCAEEGLTDVYNEAAAALAADLNKMGKPLDPTLLLGIVGVGVLGSILVINKSIR
tara:strand:- start:130 stop:792 length:663 start_codon:yes stop_codon:yes gene_type:complete